MEQYDSSVLYEHQEHPPLRGGTIHPRRERLGFLVRSSVKKNPPTPILWYKKWRAGEAGPAIEPAEHTCGG